MHCNLKEARVLLIFQACFGVKSYVVPMLGLFLTTDHICGWPALARAGASSGVFQASPCCSASFKLLLRPRMSQELAWSASTPATTPVKCGLCLADTDSRPPVVHHCTKIHLGRVSTQPERMHLNIHIFYYCWSYIEGDAKASSSPLPGQ